MPEVVNWPAVLAQLCCGQMSVYALAASLGVPRSTLRGWLDGSQPSHPDGERLIAEWMRVTGKPREQVPTERRTLSAARAR